MHAGLVASLVSGLSVDVAGLRNRELGKKVGRRVVLHAHRRVGGLVQVDVAGVYGNVAHGVREFGRGSRRSAIDGFALERQDEQRERQGNAKDDHENGDTADADVRVGRPVVAELTPAHQSPTLW